eukprot:SRR837773.3526.p2 GENE.SRR837773.3526~~SRR837773.3526.p2  ORF type:complete len:246 (-),score=90.18 SRR837773.3526:126-797(-)
MDGLTKLGVDVSSVNGTMDLIFLPWSIMFFLNIAALALCALSSGVIREVVFSRSEEYPRLKACTVCMLRSCALRIVIGLLWIMFVVSLLLSYVTFVLALVSAILPPACEGGISVVEDLITMVWKVQHPEESAAGEVPPAGRAEQAKELCDASASFAGAAARLFVGSMVPVLGQAMMVAVLYRQGERMWTELWLAEAREAELGAATDVQMSDRHGLSGGEPLAA